MPTINKIRKGQVVQTAAHNHNNRAAGHNQPYNNQTWRKFREQLIRQNPVCQLCGKKGATVADHIKPIRLGGEMYSPNNIQCICSSCHNSKSGKESRAV